MAHPPKLLSARALDSAQWHFRRKSSHMWRIFFFFSLPLCLMVPPIPAKPAWLAELGLCCHSSRCWYICMAGLWFLGRWAELCLGRNKKDFLGLKYFLELSTLWKRIGNFGVGQVKSLRSPWCTMMKCVGVEMKPQFLVISILVESYESSPILSHFWHHAQNATRCSCFQDITGLKSFITKCRPCPRSGGVGKETGLCFSDIVFDPS